MADSPEPNLEGTRALEEALRRATVLVDGCPFPVAYFGLDARLLYATPDFPRLPQDPPTSVGTDLYSWVPLAHRDRVKRYFDQHIHRKNGDAASPGRTGPVLVPEACDFEQPGLRGLVFRVYPLRSPHGPLGAMVFAFPNGLPAITVPELAEREHRHRQRLAAVLDASREISSSLEVEIILQNIVSRGRDVVDAPEAVLFLVEEDGKTLRPVVARVDTFYDEVMALRLQLGEGVVGWVAETGRAEIVNHAEKDPRSKQVPGTPVEATSLLCAPLFIKGRMAGVLALSRLGDNAFDPDDLEVAKILAAHCSVAIENARLYDDLRHTLDELRSTQTQLVQSAKLNALGELAGGVAHDFNNILTSILGRTQLLLRWVRNKQLRHALGIIEQTALDGAHAVKRIQEFTRVRQDEVAESVDLNEVVLAVVDFTRSSWQAQAKARGVQIAVNTELQATRPVLGSAPELREVFTNLVLNAIDAMPAGGSIRLETADDGDRIVVRVVDTGQGMDPETRARIFDPFFTTKPEKGTGLGLSVAYGILRRHHGDIEVESAPGRGTTFTLRFPAGFEVAARRTETPPTPELGSLRVLCVDDEPLVLEVLAELLETFGLLVERALGGREGLELARRVRPALVFTDLGMPEVNGWEVARAVKEIDPDAILVLVTGWGVQIEAETARRRGVDHILPKPFTVEDVRRVLAFVAERRGERRVA